VPDRRNTVLSPTANGRSLEHAGSAACESLCGTRLPARQLPRPLYGLSLMRMGVSAIGSARLSAHYQPRTGPPESSNNEYALASKLWGSRPSGRASVVGSDQCVARPTQSAMPWAGDAAGPFTSLVIARASYRRELGRHRGRAEPASRSAKVWRLTDPQRTPLVSAVCGVVVARRCLGTTGRAPRSPMAVGGPEGIPP
jgi:hypothetical protein